MRAGQWPRPLIRGGCPGRLRTRGVTEAAEAAASEPEPIMVLGIDETRRGRPRWTFSVETGRWVRTDAWDTGFVDLAR